MGFDDEKRYSLSVVDPLDDSVSEMIDLPLESKHQVVYGGSCVGWLYFHDLMGKIVLFNFSSKQVQVLHPPDYPEPETFHFFGCGLGYDPKSEDYKLIRIYSHQYYYISHNSLEEPTLFDAERITEVYTFKSASWKAIRSPKPELRTSNGIYVRETGCCYWIADLYEDEVYDLVLSFDFATERFHCLGLPLSNSKFPVEFNRLVECGGLLGAIGRIPSEESYMELHVLKGQAWNRLYNVSLARVHRVLGVTQDGQLLVRHLLNSRWKKLTVFDYKQIMDGLCLFVESSASPGSKPKTRSKNRRPLRMKTASKKKLNHIPAHVVDEIQPPAMSLKRCRALATGKCTFTVV